MKGGRKRLYTVKEVSEMSNITIKTLHHYHKIGLLLPSKRSEAGYRLYGTKELERLQEILFYRELDFSLDQIKDMMEHHSDRLSILAQQEELLLHRKDRLDTIVQTLRKSIECSKDGESMDNKEMFIGFASEKEWNKALIEQNEYLKASYGMDSLEVAPEEVQNINEQAVEAMTFMNKMANSLRDGIKHNDEKIVSLIRYHLAFMNNHGHNTSAKEFAAQTQFFLSDDFHLNMLESQQTGLAYYLAASAASFETTNP
ncbi:MerR family transcriptional regulator [Paenibacillus sp. MER 180]|uniref:MerR family transcriptional regulator n=1 Tax=unclassified Paenibacillus TaxID=185978 RepID=UPI0008065BE6|nr:MULTISPECIES: MerR family transcriptional regulator [unclassified Paenibacillus]MCM3293136.1 MerR family transcriptional regulator [Paenibacillus sp. MER 180]OBY77646.1 MerR family transcriptional regulator [Paenibacillus sp. KS1]